MTKATLGQNLDESLKRAKEQGLEHPDFVEVSETCFRMMAHSAGQDPDMDGLEMLDFGNGQIVIMNKALLDNQFVWGEDRREWAGPGDSDA